MSFFHDILFAILGNKVADDIQRARGGNSPCTLQDSAQRSDTDFFEEFDDLEDY